MIVSVFGWVGAVALLVAYALLTRGRVQPAGLLYVGLNLVGSAGLAASSAAASAWPSAALNLTWLAIGLSALLGPRLLTRGSPRPPACDRRGPARSSRPESR